MSLEAYPLVRDWLRLEGGRIVLRTGKVDIGQRISTALARIVAEELTLDPDDIGVASVSTASAPDEGITSGSNSVEQSGAALRLAAATLRDAAQRLAARRLGANASDLELRDGIFSAIGTNRTLHLTDAADGIDNELRVDIDAAIRTSPSAAQRAPRGLRDMVRGAFEYLHDVERPGMLHARVVRPPHRGARLAALDEERVALLRRDGVFVHRDGSFLAVAGEGEYPVQRAAERLALACDWSGGTRLAEGDLFATLDERERVSLAVEDGSPIRAPLPAPLDEPDVTAVFERPYQMHGALAPSAALAEFSDGKLRILSHSQGIYPLRESIAEALGMDETAIEIVHSPGSGCYGHNGADDAAFEAALIARALEERPILLKWTRADEHGSEPLAPPMQVRIAARVKDARIAEWSAEVTGGTHRGRPRPGPDRAGPRRFAAAQLLARPEKPFVPEPNMGRHAGLHRNLDPIYDIGERRFAKHLLRDLPLYSSAMRTLGATANVFAIEGTMEDLARQAGADPLDFRLAHLRERRDRAVLERLADLATAHPKPDGAGRGFGYGQYKNAMARVGVCVDLSLSDSGQVRLHRAQLVVDAGRVIDPDGLRAQIEGGFVQAASWSLFEEVTWDRDGVTSRDWESYPVIRFTDIPEVAVDVIAYPRERALGAGEAASGPTVGAIANAIHDACGLRLRRLPFTAERIRAAALST